MNASDRLLQQMPVPMAMFRGADHVYSFANRLHDEAMGRSNVVGKTFRDVFPELVGTPILDVFDHVYRTGEPFAAEEFSLPLVRAGKKTEAIFKFAIEPLRNEDGETYGLLTVGFDVTEQVLARWDLGAALNVQKHTETVRERMVGIVGHDLRNPLSTITVSAHMLMKQESLTPQQAKIARRIVNSSERMGRMITEILDFTEGKLGGGIPITRALINLHDVATQVHDELATVYPERQVLLAFDGDAKGHWDADRMNQMMTNLVLYGVQHAPAEVPIRLIVEDDGDGVRIEVSHAGASIPADVLPYIFDPFLRASEEAGANVRPLRGLGLGLYIAEQIVRSHGGTIEARSDSESTVFSARLPRTEPAGS